VSPSIPSSERVLATVLFTDIVGSTQRLSEMGDQRWAALLERHHEVVRAEIARHGGREVSTTGDGFVAVFDAPAPAIRCALGIRDAFDRTKADFSGISKIAGDDRLYISAVLHQAVVVVDEKGTEAAAATAVAMPTGAGAPGKAIDFIADHPFMFLIVDRATGVILFLGRVTEP
jgi:class 3 adenylate cyclase